MLVVTFVNRQGLTVTCEYPNLDSACERFAVLTEQEEITRKVAPTDSGDTRFNYTAECDALQTRLGNILE